MLLKKPLQLLSVEVNFYIDMKVITITICLVFSIVREGYKTKGQSSNSSWYMEAANWFQLVYFSVVPPCTGVIR